MDPFSTASIAALFTSVFALDVLADVLNLRAARKPLPEPLRSVQTPEQQQRAAEYLADRLRVGVLHGLASLALLLWMLQADGFGWLQRLVQSSTDSGLLQALAYAALWSGLRALLQLPFAAFSTFVVEARYGFNRTTVSTFVGDRVKGALVGAVLGGALFSFVYEVYARGGGLSYLWIWLGFTAFQFFILWIAPVTLLPLFLKLTPLPEGEIKNEIEAYRRQQSFVLDGAYVCDASRRSAKSNAFFIGFGKFRRLVLFDTLIERHPPAEITAIVAHEAGHFKLGHIWKGTLLSSGTSLVAFFVVQKMIESPSLYSAFGAEPGNVGIGLVLSKLVLDQLSFFLSPIGASLSRQNEYAADRFSARTTGDVSSLANGLKRLVTENLATLQHHPLYRILHDSHPPLPERIAALERIRKENPSFR